MIPSRGVASQYVLCKMTDFLTLLSPRMFLYVCIYVCVCVFMHMLVTFDMYMCDECM